MTWVGRTIASLRARLLLAHLVVIATGVATLLLAATLLAPTFFDRHMADMGGMAPGRRDGLAVMQAEMASHLTRTFHQTLLESLTLATLAALVTATILSLVLSERVAGPIRRVAWASTRLAGGQYSERVPLVGPNEIRQLIESFNAMAATLEGTERQRRELIGDVAHELRTPIATLEGYLEGLLDGVVEPTPENWTRLQTETRRLRRLVEDLQELSRAEAQQLQLVLREVEPQTMVQAGVDRLAADFTAVGLTLRVELTPALPAVRADPDRAVQVITNLLTNALRYSPAPGNVVVSAQAVAGRVRFQVADHGIGLASEDLPHVFDRFYRVDKSRSRQLGGTGIGLTIAKALTEAMGGRIWATSPGPGLGATFGFDLPIWSRKEPANAR